MQIKTNKNFKITPISIKPFFKKFHISQNYTSHSQQTKKYMSRCVSRFQQMLKKMSNSPILIKQKGEKVEPETCARVWIGSYCHVAFGTWERFKKGSIPLGWALTLFDRFSGGKQSRDGVDQWKKDSEKREFCSNSMYTFRSFHVLKMVIRLITLQLQFMSFIYR